MTKKIPGGVYDLLTPEERFHLVLEAAARLDETEVERLANTCQRYTYTSTRNDPAFTERIRASRQIAFCVCLMLMQILAKLTAIRASQECAALLSSSLVTVYQRGYLLGWETGYKHARQTAGMAEPVPCRDNDDLGRKADEVVGASADEGENADDDDELAEVAEAMATEVATIWGAFSRFCRAEMGAQPSTLVLAWVPQMQGWIEGALNAADGVQVDAEALFEYETALTNAWRELLRGA